MKSPSLAVMSLALSVLSAQASAGTLAGAADGQYRAQDGSFVVVDSAANSIGIELMDCAAPVLADGHLKSDKCMANGHVGGGVDVAWRTERGMVFVNGRSYAPLPKMPPPAPLAKPDPFEPTPEAWLHNGSSVKVDPGTGRITYMAPKASLKRVAKPGSVIFDGSLRTSGMVLGTAYAFKEGCPPASYPVRGVYSKENELLTLTGPGPKREGCEVVAYDYASPHSKLVFTYAVGD